MAKVPFSKLDVKILDSVKILSYHNSKGEQIDYEVKFYLPIEEKMEMISKIINQSLDDNGFYNPMRLQIFTVLEVFYAYTNLNFTAKQKENPFKLYDQLVSSGLFDEVKNNIWEKDWEEIEKTIITTIDNIYKYQNSAKGILEEVVADYGNLNLEASDIQHSLADPTNMEFLKAVLDKLG